MKTKQLLTIEIVVAAIFALGILIASKFFDLSQTGMFLLIAGYIVVAGLVRFMALKSDK